MLPIRPSSFLAFAGSLQPRDVAIFTRSNLGRRVVQRAAEGSQARTAGFSAAYTA
jgi:hypothetical protein